jgi:hypothetical protein
MRKQTETLIELDLLSFHCLKISQKPFTEQGTITGPYKTTVSGVLQISREHRSALLLDYFIMKAQIFKLDNISNIKMFTPLECYFPNALYT